MKHCFVERLIDIANEDGRIMVVGSDQCLPQLHAFARKLPAQFVCVSETDGSLAGVAAGLGMDGRVVFACASTVWSFVPFARQLRSASAVDSSIVNLVSFNHAVGSDEAPAHARDIEDLALMRSITDMTVVTPGTDREAMECVESVALLPGACFVRLSEIPRSPSVSDDREPFEVGRIRCLRGGRDASIFAAGSVVSRALEASERLSVEHGLECEVLSCHTLNPIDVVAVERAARATGRIVVVEEHSIHGGLAGVISETLAEHSSAPVSFSRIGLRARPGLTETWAEYVERECIDVPRISDEVRRLCGSHRLRAA